MLQSTEDLCENQKQKIESLSKELAETQKVRSPHSASMFKLLLLRASR